MEISPPSNHRQDQILCQGSIFFQLQNAGGLSSDSLGFGNLFHSQTARIYVFYPILQHLPQ